MLNSKMKMRCYSYVYYSKEMIKEKYFTASEMMREK